MNDENNEPVANDELAAAVSLNAELSEEVAALGDALAEKMQRVRDLEAERDSAPPLAVAPAGDEELQALAVTIRNAQRAGHPDVSKHMDALLTLLGAV